MERMMRQLVIAGVVALAVVSQAKAFSMDDVGIWDASRGRWDVVTTTNIGGVITLADQTSGVSMIGDYGASTWQPVVADVNGDGVDDCGLWNLTTGPGYGKFDFVTTTAAGILTGDNIIGNYGISLHWTAVTGDVNGDGLDDCGLWKTTTGGDGQAGKFDFVTTTAAGILTGVDMIGFYGIATTWQPLVADVNGDGYDDCGLYNFNNGKFDFKLTTPAGILLGADVIGFYGPATSDWEPITADINGDGMDDMGLFNNTNGKFDFVLTTAAGILTGDNIIAFYGGSAWTPVMGQYNVPEPATTALLIVGAAAILRRRSR